MKIKLLSCLLAVLLLGSNAVRAYTDNDDEKLLDVEVTSFQKNLDVNTVEKSSTPL